MEEWSQWLLQSLVSRAGSYGWFSKGELAALMQDEAQAPAWWAMQLSDAPSSAARLIQLANSAAYAGKRPAFSLEDAIETLGHQTARHILFQDIAERIFPTRGKEWITWAPRWRHVMAVAASAATVARHQKLNPGELFVAGLLHDIGQHMLLKQGGEPYQRLEARFGADADPSALAKAELEHMGFDHSMLGAAIAAHVGLPSSVVSALRDHHRVGTLKSEIAAGSHLSRVAIMDLAESMAACFGYGPQGPEYMVEGNKAWFARLRELALSPANQVLKLNIVELWWLKRKVEVQIQAVMSVARGGEGLLWEGPGLLERVVAGAERLRQRTQERLAGLGLEKWLAGRRPQALPAPVLNAEGLPPQA